MYLLLSYTPMVSWSKKSYIFLIFQAPPYAFNINLKDKYPIFYKPISVLSLSRICVQFSLKPVYPTMMENLETYKNALFPGRRKLATHLPGIPLLKTFSPRRKVGDLGSNFVINSEM